MNSRELVRAMDDDRDPWFISNQALYSLCAENPGHRDSRVAIAKTLLIGRTYAAAIERRKKSRGGSEALGDAFYVSEVGPTLSSSQLDKYLATLPLDGDADLYAERALETHAYLLALFRQMTGEDKRSLASKYLHFHRPSVFFIYDSRAARAIGQTGTKLSRLGRVPNGVDEVYWRFVMRSLDWRRRIADEHDVVLTPRQLDRLLLRIAAREA